MNPWNIVIIGGGIVGSAVAYFVARSDEFSGTVLVVEEDDSYDRSSTVRSASAIRQQFNLGLNVQMSTFGYEFYKHAHSYLRIGEEEPDIDFVDCPYLVLASPGGAERLRAAWERQTAHGADVAFLSLQELVRRVPWLHTDDLGAACLGLNGEGWFDPRTALAALRRKVTSLGVRYINARVEGLMHSDSRITQVVLTDGTLLTANAVVNAAGPRAAQVARMAGIDIPVESRKRTAFVFSTPTPPDAFVNLVDPTVAQRGLYARPYGENFMAVTSPPPDRDPETPDLQPDTWLFDEIVRPALARRVRGFERVDLVKAWAGHYEFNTFDQNAILGAHPCLGNFYFACGFSGHGVMHAPAAGRGIAELLTLGSYKTIDLGPMGYKLLTAGQPLDDIQPSEHRSVRAGI